MTIIYIFFNNCFNWFLSLNNEWIFKIKSSNFSADDIQIEGLAKYSNTSLTSEEERNIKFNDNQLFDYQQNTSNGKLFEKNK